jgi:hypothetical protein
MKAMHVEPGLPRWHPSWGPAVQRAFAAHRRLAGLVVLALIVALVSFGAIVAVTPRQSDSARLGTSVDTVAITASRADAQWLDSQLKALKSSRAAVAPLLLTLDPAAIAASKADAQWLDSQVKALKSSRGTVEPPAAPALPDGSRYEGKPLPN